MMSRPILFDVTALVAHPHRSGIQRVQREVLRHWPYPERLMLCTFDPSGGIHRLPSTIRDVLCRAEDRLMDTVANDQVVLRRLIGEGTRLRGSGPHHVLNLELFYESWRADAYLAMCKDGWRVQWLLYDFMPWLLPEFFPQGSTKYRLQYLRALRRVPEVAFISEQTRIEYSKRVMRDATRSGPVLPLGADGLGLERQIWSPDRRFIVVLGTVERRKNPLMVADAFRLLWARGIDTCLVFAGRVEDTQQAALKALAAEAGPERMRVMNEPSDSELRTLLRRTRAVLSASEVEGFGLPPYEALNSGIPAIASDTLPSMQLLPPRGHISLPVLTRESLADAVQMMMDDTKAARLWAEAAELRLPRWEDFAVAVAQWSEAGAD